jgi:hypothetical protein
MSSFLMLGAAWMFFQGKDNTASIAAFSAGLLLLGAWLTTAVIDWHKGSPQHGTSTPYNEQEPVGETSED